ncbi:uncharacterized protein EAF02_002433 [Botrytis sinoallii]|uniref:uncharacterized protein n=1 Tax=Botrytis sinoallii TaxID=1463999 RepID=UPI0018FFEDF6|nr:uncharacterized protein EAF02_002433 [Botrytis sinoallii]KAF7890018.1 hypothetical protein EAF02_002433 [Botrytis sinoallii]
MSAPRNRRFESVAEFVKRYSHRKRQWENIVSSGGQVDLGITEENLRRLGHLGIPKGVNKDSLIKPSEDWFKEHPEFREDWESMIKNFRGGREIIEAKPSLNTAGFLSAKPNQTADLQKHSKLNEDAINPSTSFLMPSQTHPGNSNPFSATPGATTTMFHGGNSSIDGWINQWR